jgi:GTPase
MFYDQAKIYVRSGDGGDGMISFRREKHVPRGGPDGGDGGRGGDVIVTVNENLNSLARFHRKVHFKAGNGRHGGRSRKTGASGEHVQIEVPPGTIIRDAETGDLLADLTSPEQEVVLFAGGRGGKGNTRYASSVHRVPRLAERGEPGVETWLELELKLIADVGIIGVPNAGKSTLLSVVSAARPKIADYPFTTLQPYLGVVTVDDYETMVWADIPGLIEGAAGGAGLGHDFLRHIERTRVLIHLLDGGGEDPLSDWAMINQELTLYDETLEDRPQIVVLNKMDLPQAVEREAQIKKKVTKAGYPFMTISAATQEGIQPLIYRVKQLLEEAPPRRPFVAEAAVIRPEPDEGAFTIEREAEGWRVSGQRIERIAAMTYWEFEATTRRFQQILENSGISAALRQAGIEDGEIVYIGAEELEWSDED